MERVERNSPQMGGALPATLSAANLLRTGMPAGREVDLHTQDKAAGSEVSPREGAVPVRVLAGSGQQTSGRGSLQ